MIDVIRARRAYLGELEIFRALPVRERRLVGPWCFLDRYGPLSFTGGRTMDVAPHPHIGIQTVSWLLEGEVRHLDSLGFEAIARPGAVNVMTSGSGISHAEVTPRENRGTLNGVQLWVALPDAHRNVAPSFTHVPEVPRLDTAGGIVQVFSGSLGNASSVAPRFSEMVGADVEIHRGEALGLPLEASFEHALFVVAGDADLEGQRLETNVLYYLGTGRSSVEIRSAGGARMLLIGGRPFDERVLMWWNFVARTPEEIAAARAAWESGERFGVVQGYDGPRIDAPGLGRLAAPNPAS